MIGLIDCEALHMKEPFIPNLEIMKLYSYFKKTQLAKLILSPEILDSYNQIYLRRDFETTTIPKEWTVNRPVKWGGLSFNNGNYRPMTPEIEMALPNYRVYNEYIRTMLGGHPKILDEATKYLDYSFLRLATNTPIQPRHINEGMPLLIYDTDLFQTLDYRERFAIIAEQEPSKIYFLHTPNFLQKEHLDAFIDFDIIKGEVRSLRTTPIILNLYLDVTNFKSFIRKYRDYFNTFTRRKVMLPAYPIYDCITQTPLHLVFEKIANLVYCSYSEGVPIGIAETKIQNEQAQIVMDVFAAYVNRTDTGKKLFSDYYFGIRSKKIKPILKKFYDDNLQLHYLFDVSLTYLLLGGTWYGQFRNSPTSQFH